MKERMNEGDLSNVVCVLSKFIVERNIDLLINQTIGIYLNGLDEPPNSNSEKHKRFC